MKALEWIKPIRKNAAGQKRLNVPLFLVGIGIPIALMMFFASKRIENTIVGENVKVTVDIDNIANAAKRGAQVKEEEESTPFATTATGPEIIEAESGDEEVEDVYKAEKDSIYLALNPEDKVVLVDNGDNPRPNVSGEETFGGLGATPPKREERPVIYITPESGKKQTHVVAFNRFEVERKKRPAESKDSGGAKEKIMTGYDMGVFLPKGTQIPVVFMEPYDSRGDSGFVTVAVTENVFFNHKLMLPYGTKIFVRANGELLGNRIRFLSSSYLLPDGTEGQMTGVLKGGDGLLGVAGILFDRQWGVRTANLTSALSAAYLSILQQRQSGQASPYAEPTSQTLNDAIVRIIDEERKRIEAANPIFVQIPRGTPAVLQLESSHDLTLAKRGFSEELRLPESVKVTTKEGELPQEFLDSLANGNIYQELLRNENVE